MGDKKKKRSKLDHKPSRSSRSSRAHNQGGEIPRDPKVEQAMYINLSQYLQTRVSLTYRYENLVSQLAARKSGNETAEYLYSILISVDFQVIRVISSSANAARERRGVINPAGRDLQTTEVNRETRFYQEWNQALAMQGGIAAMPQSLQQFAADEMALIREIAELQREMADNQKNILSLQAWFGLSDEQLDDMSQSGGRRYDGDDDEGGAAGAAAWGSELPAGEYVGGYY